MDKQNQLKYINLLKSELIVALGCTEPIAIALACAKAKEVLGSIPDKIIMRCSGNIIKNAKSVTVPNSNGKQGIQYAALLGCIGGKSELMLEVLSQVNENHLQIAEKLFNVRFMIILFIGSGSEVRHKESTYRSISMNKKSI